LPSGGNIPEEILDLIAQVPDCGLDRLGRGEHNLRRGARRVSTWSSHMGFHPDFAVGPLSKS
jgi:hypothetical protein